MRLKGINPLEQHAEKAFLGIFLVAGLGVLAWQFVGKENTVKVGKDEVRLADAYAKVDEERRRTDARIRLADPEGLPPINAEVAVKELANFEARYRGPVAPAPTLAAALDKGGLGLRGDSPTARDLIALAEARPPVPAAPTAGAYMAAVDPIEARDPEVAAVLPPAAPMDKAWVSVESAFDGAALRKALSDDPDGDGPIRPMPRNWWDGSLALLAVQMERQELRPDGSWTEPQPVKAMPGRPVVTDLDRLNTAAELKDRSRWATDNAALVRRPDFYAIQVGDAWAPPSERERRLGEEGDKAQRIKTKYAERNDRIRRRDAQVKELQGLGGAPAPGGGAGGGRPGPGGPGAGGPGRPTPPLPPGGPGQQDDPRKRGLQASIDRLNAEIARIEGELRELGENVGDPAQAGGAGNANQAPQGPTEAALLDNPSLRVWGHDVFVERGKTYRYRVRLALTNPYFGHGAAMLPAQAGLASKGVWYTPSSEWSAPVRVDPETYLFFTSATPDDPGTRIASARAEVYQFRWGYWRKGQTTLEPGDAVSTEVRVPDLAKMIAEMPAADPAAPGVGGRPGVPPAPQRGGPGATVPPGGRDTPPGGVPADPAPAGQGRQTRPAGVPMIGVAITDPTIMLGVTTAQAVDSDGRPRNVQQVYLREPAGQVVVRVPENERQEATYRRVADSAERGERDPGIAPPANRPGNNPPPDAGQPRDNPQPDGVPPSPGG